MRSGSLPELQTKYGLGAGGVTPGCVAGRGPQLCRRIRGRRQLGPGDSGRHADVRSRRRDVPDRSHLRQRADHLGRQRPDHVLPVRRRQLPSAASSPATTTSSTGSRSGSTDPTGSSTTSRSAPTSRTWTATAAPSPAATAPTACCSAPGGHRPTSTTRSTSTRSSGLHRAYRFPNPAAGLGAGARGSTTIRSSWRMSHSASREVGRTFGGINAECSATPWLSFAYTLGADYSNDERTQAWPWSTSNTTVVGRQRRGRRQRRLHQVIPDRPQPDGHRDATR